MRENINSKNEEQRQSNKTGPSCKYNKKNKRTNKQASKRICKMVNLESTSAPPMRQGTLTLEDGAVFHGKAN